MLATFAGMSGFPYLSPLMIDLYPPQDIFTNTYHFGIGTVGLAYIGLGVGFLFGFIFGSKSADQIYRHVSICFHAQPMVFLKEILFCHYIACR